MKFTGKMVLELISPEEIKTECPRETKLLNDAETMGWLMTKALIARMKFDGVPKEDRLRLLIYTFGALGMACQKAFDEEKNKENNNGND